MQNVRNHQIKMSMPTVQAPRFHFIHFLVIVWILVPINFTAHILKVSKFEVNCQFTPFPFMFSTKTSGPMIAYVFMLTLKLWRHDSGNLYNCFVVLIPCVCKCFCLFNVALLQQKKNSCNTKILSRKMDASFRTDNKIETEIIEFLICV